MCRGVSDNCRGSSGGNATVTKRTFPFSSSFPLSPGRHRGPWWEVQPQGGSSCLKHDRFGGDDWVKLTNDHRLKACATVNGEQMERAWEGATFAVLGGAMAGSRDILGRAKLAPVFLLVLSSGCP